MGIKQSKEEVEPILKLLRSISSDGFEQAKQKLIDLTRNKCKLQVSKWEMLLILQMSAKDVKIISQFISGDNDPLNIDVNSLFFLMVVTQPHSLGEKIYQIISFISFDKYMIYLDEFRYIFQLAYQFLQRITDLDLIERPVIKAEQGQDIQYGCQIEFDLVRNLFGKDGSDSQVDSIDISSVKEKMIKMQDAQSFFQIFQHGKIMDQSAEELLTSMKTMVDASMTQKSNDTRELKSSKKDLNQSKQNESAIQADKSKDKIEEAKAEKGQEKEQVDQTDKKSEVKDEAPQISRPSFNPPQEKPKMNLRVNVQGDSQMINSVSVAAGSENMQQTKNEQRMFGLRSHGPVSIKNSNSLSFIKMSKRILELKNENQMEININDLGDNLQKYQINVDMIINKNLELYAQRQFLPFMRSLFAQRKVQDLPSGKGTQVLLQAINDQPYNSNNLVPLTVKRSLRNSLDEYIQQNLAQLKYLHAEAKQKMMHMYGDGSQRGYKRQLEKKKFQVLGQLQTLKSLFSSIIEYNYKQDLLTDDSFYQHVYTQVQNMYDSQIDHTYLLEMMTLKNQKSESKKLISFLKGANTQVSKICENELLVFDPQEVKFPSVYADAKDLIHEKLQNQMHLKHIKIVKEYMTLKIKLVNYFTNLGKLKAFYKCQKLPRNQQDMVNFFNQNIKRLRLKMEKIDIELSNFTLSQQNKKTTQHVFYQSLGQIAVIKCGVKNLDFQHIYDYFVMELIKQRTNEALWLQMQIASDKEVDQELASEVFNYTSNRIQKLNYQGIYNLLRFQRMKYFDKGFDVGGDSDSSNSGMYNKALYEKDLDKTQETYSIYSKKFQYVPLSQNDQKSEIETLTKTTKESLNNIYDRLDLFDNFKNISHFQDTGPLRRNVFDLNVDHEEYGTKDELNQFIDTHDQLDDFIYDFYPFTNSEEFKTVKSESNRDSTQQRPDPEDYDRKYIYDHLIRMSGGFKNILEQNEPNRKYVYDHKMKAFDQMSYYLGEQIEQIEMNDFTEIFKQQRDEIFNKAMETLFSINKKNFLNGFNMIYLSMPLLIQGKNNYYSYQTLKIYISEQMKAKIVTDVCQIANQNEIFCSSLQQSAVNLLDVSSYENNQDMSNTASRKSSGVTFAFKRASSIHRKYATNYADLFQLLLTNNQRDFEKKGKQSLFKEVIQQFQYQHHLYSVKEEVLQDMLALRIPQFQNMYTCQTYINSKVDAGSNESVLNTIFEQYEKAFIIMNRAYNIKAIDQHFVGSIQYLDKLQHILIQELQEQNTNEDEDFLTQFITRLKTHLTNVCNNSKNKHKNVLKELKRANESIGNSSAMHKDILPKYEQDQTERNYIDDHEKNVFKLEVKIIANICLFVNYLDLMILSKQYNDVREFKNALNEQRLINLNKKAKIEGFIKYYKSASFLVEGKQKEQWIGFKHQSKGAKILNSVISGNIFNKIDIFNDQNFNSGSSSNHESNAQLARASQASLEELLPKDEAQLELEAKQSLQSQKCLNYLINFLSQICALEDRLTSVRVIRMNNLFFFSQMQFMNLTSMKNRQMQLCNIQFAMTNLINVYELQEKSVNKYLKNYEKQATFIKKELFQAMNKSSQLLIAKFYHVISQNGPPLVKSIINKIDEVFSEAQLNDEEKTDFGNAQTNIRKRLDIDLRVFREFIDVESNKKMTEQFESSIKQQEIKMTQSITTMHILTRIYYLKQIQQMENFLNGLELNHKARNNVIEEEENDGKTPTERAKMS